MPEKTYNLPAAIATALSTDRYQICEAFANAVEELPDLPADAQAHIAGMARLIGDLLTDRALMRSTLVHLGNRIEQSRDQFDALANYCETAQHCWHTAFSRKPEISGNHAESAAEI